MISSPRRKPSATDTGPGEWSAKPCVNGSSDWAPIHRRMGSACAKRWNGSACTIASLFRKISCWWISTGSRRFRRRDEEALCFSGDPD
ncbi:hypothetical protein RHECNPAF_12600120 [Rhizobium etli CNPAF512]|nr:hypothetical protein RHECNPAF_12600120 [Rhizobium etli CNPAF512]